MKTAQSRPYILAETDWKTVRETDYDLAVLPWGATEAHNYHLPYATDNIQCDFVAAESARLAWEKGGKCIVFPTVPFGVNTGQADIKFCLNMNPSTQFAVLKDIVDVLNRQGISKLVILNGHGGNSFKQMSRELSLLYPAVFVCEAHWFRAAPRDDYFSAPGDHADEMETSVMMHIAPGLVKPLDEAGDGHAKQFKIKALRQGWASAQRQWSAVTEDTGTGNPKAASPEKGKAFLDEVCRNMSEFFLELGAANLNDMYE